MGTQGERSKYAISLDELERSTQVPVEEQVTSQPATDREPAISEYELHTARLLGIEHAG
jgi:hypothetical protein